MQTQTQETLPPNNAAALSTPQTIDIVAIVGNIARRKSSSLGEYASAKKGKSLLVAQVASALKSALGMAKDAKLTDNQHSEVIAAVDTFWRNSVDKLMAWGSVVSVNMGVNNITFDGSGNVKTFNQKGVARFEREFGDASERRRFVNEKLSRQRKRLDYMQENAGNYTGEQLAATRNSIANLEAMAASAECLPAASK